MTGVLNEDEIKLISKQYNSHFVTHEIPPGIYTNKDISDAVYTMGDHEETLQLDFDDIIMKTKLVLSRFGCTFGTKRFDKKIVFSYIFGIFSLL